MKKVDINVTPATNASLSVTVGDVIADSQDNKATIVYIDYVGDIVVAVDGSEATNISFDVLAGGEYQQVIENQIVLIFLLLLLQVMPRQSINVVKANISLIVGDNIVDNLGNIFEVAYIDYARENIIVVPDDDTVSGNRASVLTFGIVACNYKKVIEDQIVIAKNITTKNDTISLGIGDEIVDGDGNKAKILYIDYNSKIVVIIQNGEGHNLSFEEIVHTRSIVNIDKKNINEL